MNLDLTGKTALVCGSTQGIGLAAAKEIAALGASVILCARDAQRLQQCRGALPADRGQQHATVVADFARPSQVQSQIERLIQTGVGVQILVNNTGGPPAGAALEASADDYRQAFNSHLVCNQLLVQATVPGMKDSGYGRIINVISTSVKQPIVGLGVSNTIRGAVANWAKTLAHELAPFGITVNNVLPGTTDTTRLQSIITGRAEKSGTSVRAVAEQMQREVPFGRFAQPGEIGAAIAFLASPAASYITGINLPVDGGRTLCL